MSSEFGSKDISWTLRGEVDPDELSSLGDGLDSFAQEVLRKELFPPETNHEFLERTRPGFDRRTIAAKLDTLLEQANYEPAHGRWRLIGRFGSFAIRKSGELVGYHDTLLSAETAIVCMPLSRGVVARCLKSMCKLIFSERSDFKLR